MASKNPIPLNDKAVTPAYLLRDFLQEVDDIEGIVLIVRGKNGQIRACWTNMSEGDLLMGERVLRLQLDEIIRPQLDM